MLHREHRQFQADHPAHLAGPQPAGVDDVLGVDLAGVGDDVPRAVGALAKVAHPGVLVDLGAGLPRAGGIGPGDPGRVDVTLGRVEERADKVLLLEEREHPLGLGRRDDLQIHAEVAAAGLGHPQPVHPLPVAGQHQSARHVDGTVLAGALFDLAVQLDGVLLQLRDIGVTVERVHAARGVPGRAGGELLALDEHDIRPAQFGEVVQDRGADHTTADDDYLRGSFHPGIPTCKFSRYSRSDYKTMEVLCMGRLLDRLAAGPVICAEGYLFEFERRGYLQAGAFVPEVVLEEPEMVAGLHREFVHAGSDVVEAFTYYAHREKLAVIGREGDLEPMNRQALRIAKEVGAEHDSLVAGNICNTNVYDPDDPATHKVVRDMFTEQVGWAAEAGVDFVIAETIDYPGEALLALEAIKAHGLDAVVTLTIHRQPIVRGGDPIGEACRRLQDAGADVVGLNCIRGLATMLPLIGEIRAACDGYIAALPVPYRTTEAEPTFQSLTDPHCDLIPEGRPFPTALDPFLANRYEVGAFTTAAAALGVNYFGICCGCAPHHVRAMAEALGRTPPASRFSADMSRHAYYGTSERISRHYQEFAKEL